MPQTFTKITDSIYRWTDTCHSYVIRKGESAILFDLGDGSVLDHLGEIGVKNLDWVLFTHHHREQCQGAAKLAPWREKGTKVAAPEGERAFFENPTSFRKMRPTLGDAFAVHGASYVRPPIEPIAIDRAIKKMDLFAWGGREFICTDVSGNSPGHTSFLFKEDNSWHGITGDLMLDGGKMHTWFDTEWDYGFGIGIYAIANAAALVAGYEPRMLLPSHGPLIKNVQAQLLDYIEKLKKLESFYLRGYSIFKFANCDQDTVSRPTAVPHVWQVSPHLFKFRGPNYWVNFAIIIAPSGRGFVIDCGLFDRDFLDQAIEGMKERLGLKGIDAVFVTHVHGDHALDAGHLRRKHGAKLWTMEGINDKFERPWDFDLSALITSYNDRGKPDILEPMSFDKVYKDGDKISWEGFKFQIDWMPGQTKFHACLHGEIDQRKVAFCGDNIFASTTDPAQGGNECVLARNGGALEEGYLYAAAYLHKLRPDLIIGGHCWALDKPGDLIDRYQARMKNLREAYQALSVEPDYRVMFDPYWVQVLPYRVSLKPGQTAKLTLHVRNFWPDLEEFKIAFHALPGVTVTPGQVATKLASQRQTEIPITVTAAADAKEGTRIVAINVTVGERRFGEWFDFLVHVGDPPPARTPMLPMEKPKY